MEPKMIDTIKNNVRDCLTLPWERLRQMERNSLKEAKGRDVEKLKRAILNLGFNFPFFIWAEHDYILDGAGRIHALSALEMDGVPIPELPVVEIHAETLDEAKALVLHVSSEHGVISQSSFQAFAEGLDIESLSFSISLPDIDLGRLVSFRAAEKDPDEVPEAPAEPVTKLGDLYEIGAHRLLCGDSTSAEQVEKLMGGLLADICFTSPPYGQQRDYGQKITDWDALMNGVFAILPVKDASQVFVNLGLIHRDNEWIPYWAQWLEFMKDAGWRRFGWYVWDQGPGLPGDWNGRLAPSFEFIFHFNKASQKANKTKNCKHAGEENHGSCLRNSDGTVSGYTASGKHVQSKKIPDSTIRVMRHKARGVECEHPAVFPVDLPLEFYEAYSDDDALAFEPFGGSGTSMVAAHQSGRTAYLMELSPHYCDVIVARMRSLFPDLPITRNGEVI